MIYGDDKMYVYQITNLINNKQYIGITNNIKKRWSNEKSYPSNPVRRQVIQEAIHKYGKDNFDFAILYQNLSIEQAVELEAKLIKEKNTLVPNGYNVDKGGQYHAQVKPKYGADNGNAKLSEDEAQYILDNRDKPLYVLYDEFSEYISYDAFRKVYHHQTYQNLSTNKSEYPYNREFSCQFTSGPLEYDDIVQIRKRYAKGEYWRDVYKDYKQYYPNDWTFWNIYVGNRYRLVMPEVFTKENKKKHLVYSKCGTNNGRAKLTEQDIIAIREKWKNGCSRKELYEAYPQVSQTSIRDIINNKTWKHLL